MTTTRLSASTRNARLLPDRGLGPPGGRNRKTMRIELRILVEKMQLALRDLVPGAAPVPRASA